MKADATTLMEQATITTERYLIIAIKCIDNQFGEGYAKKHPELIGTFMQTAAHDFHATFMAQKIEDIADNLGYLVEVVRDLNLPHITKEMMENVDRNYERLKAGGAFALK